MLLKEALNFSTVRLCKVNTGKRYVSYRLIYLKATSRTKIVLNILVIFYSLVTVLFAMI